MRPTIQMLEPELIARILGEAKRIMAETGMEIRGAKMRQRLIDAGLPTDANGRVLFPAEVVDRAIATAPKSFTLFNRDGDPHANIGGWNVHFIPGSSGLKIMDHRTGETRLANSTDFVEYARLCDGLPHIPYLATAFSTNADIEPQVSDAWRLYMVLTNTKKPVVSGAFGEHGVKRMADMMQLFRRDRADLIARPMSIFTITATGNFRFGEDSCQNMLDCVEAGIPVEIVPVTLMGLIAPVTLVGALVFHCVDVLTGITMAQVVKPGAPVLFGGAPATFHMRAASSPMAAIEAQRLNVAYVQIAKSLGLPTQAYMALSDGKFLDAQAGAETMTSAMLAALAGVNSVSGPGMLDFVLTFSLAKLLFDNEVCGQCLNFVRETHVLEDLPARTLVDDLRQNDHLITSPHTLKYWPQELYLTDPIFDRENRETWIKQGSHDLQARAREQVDKRLAAYVQVQTDPAADAEMRRMIVAGMKDQKDLPVLPPPPEHSPNETAAPGRRRTGRRPQATARSEC
ncbi:MAG TPA: trimethylamine methyltransferase family protein [Steroidobacteraceae bacterium]|nr:trimethylamine methyltransferase family protein [Steroidobacteraceae bacterium]